MTGVNIQTIFCDSQHHKQPIKHKQGMWRSTSSVACDIQDNAVKTLKNIIIYINFDFYKISGETIIKRFPSKSDQNFDIYQRVKTIILYNINTDPHACYSHVHVHCTCKLLIQLCFHLINTNRKNTQRKNGCWRVSI